MLNIHFFKYFITNFNLFIFRNIRKLYARIFYKSNGLTVFYILQYYLVNFHSICNLLFMLFIKNGYRKNSKRRILEIIEHFLKIPFNISLRYQVSNLFMNPLYSISHLRCCIETSTPV